MPLLVKKRNTLFFIILLIFPSFSVFAEEGTAVLFIRSDPINSNIIIDKTPLLQKTPVIIRNIESGKHIIGIRKEGFSPVDFEISLEAGETKVFTAELSRGTIISGFPDNKSNVLHTDDDTLLPATFRLTEGSYNFRRTDNNLYITPLYPKQNILTTTGTLFLTSLAATIASVAIEIKEKGTLSLPFSNMLVITETTTTITGLAELALLIDKRRFIENFELFKADPGTLDSGAAELFNSAQNALSNGRIEDALSGFSELLGSYPDYSGFPEALYKTARLHLIAGDTNLAISELNIIINEFPDPDFYDKACQTLSLLYFNSGESEKSRKAVEQMVFYDPIFSGTVEDINKTGIDKVIENWAGTPERQAE